MIAGYSQTIFCSLGRRKFTQAAVTLGAFDSVVAVGALFGTTVVGDASSGCGS